MTGPDLPSHRIDTFRVEHFQAELDPIESDSPNRQPRIDPATAVRQAISCLEAWLLLYEEQTQEVARQLKDNLDRLRADLNEFERLRGKGDRKRALILAPPGERMLKCFTLRLQQVMHERLVGIYVALRGFCAECAKTKTDNLK